MTERSISRDAVIASLAEVFREQGYDGASLSRLAAATGLRKPTLYYHFPGGKEEMAEAVLDALAAWFDGHIFQPLTGPEPPAQRIAQMRTALDRHFAGGAAICLFARFALGATRDRFQSRIGDFYGRWISSLAQALIADGQDPDDAVRRAADAIMTIEGALTMSRALDDTGPFQRALRHLPERLAVDLPAEYEGAAPPAKPAPKAAAPPETQPAADATDWVDHVPDAETLDDMVADAAPPADDPSPIDDDDSVI